MISKITSFFTNQKKNILIYLDEEKNSSVSVEITPQKTITEIHYKNINQISHEIAKLQLNKNNSQSNENNANFLNTKREYVLINKNDSYTRIKFKDNDIPWWYLVRSKDTKISNHNFSLFYIFNLNYNSNIYSNGIKKRLYDLTNSNKNAKTYSSKISHETRIINFVSPENKLIDGELEKYSFIDNKFENKFIYIDNSKLMYKNATSGIQKILNVSGNATSPYNESSYIRKNSDIYDTNDLWTVISFATISNIIKSPLDSLDMYNINIKKYGRQLFIVNTINEEKHIFKANNYFTREKWYSIIKNVLDQIKIDKYFFKYDEDMNSEVKEMYLNLIYFVNKLFSYKGIIYIKEARKYFIKWIINAVENQKNYNSYDDEQIELDKEIKIAYDVINKINNCFEGKKFYKWFECYCLQSLGKDGFTVANFIGNDKIYKKLGEVYKEIDGKNKDDDNDYSNMLFNVVMKKILYRGYKKMLGNKYDFYLGLRKIFALKFCNNNQFKENKMINFLDENKYQVFLKKCNKIINEV